MDSTIVFYCVGLMGGVLVQDGLASIAFYPQEKWRWNHIARLIRIIIGIALVILAGIMI